MLLHMRTGIDIVHTGRIPHRDPYSFTAFGHPWVVQSWLAETSYGVAHAIAGYHGVVIEQGLLMGALAFIIAVLARTGATWRTVVSAGVVVLASVPLWSQRPLLFGLLGMALTMFVVERRRSPLLLLPVVWVWANSHGSFPFGLAWLGASYVGTILDTRARPRALEPYLGAFIGGLALAMVNPFGPRLIAFPLVLQQKHKVFQNIIEWKSPDFQTLGIGVSLVFLTLGLACVLRRGAGWRDVLPLVGFLAAGLISERNLAVAAVVLAPPLARALRPSVDSLSSRDESERRESLPPAVPALGLGIAAAALLLIAARQPPLDLHSYPVGALRSLAANHQLGMRIVAADVVGDYRAFAEPAADRVFIDDRYDMYPTQVVEDSLAIIAGHGAALTALDKWHVDAVVWRKGQGPTDLLQLTGGWRTAWNDDTWLVLVRDPSVPPHRPA